MNGAPIVISDPVVSYRETVTAESSPPCMSKSPNKHNRLYVKAKPLGYEATTTSRRRSPTRSRRARSRPRRTTKKTRTRSLVEKYDWDKATTQKIWCFGPDGSGARRTSSSRCTTPCSTPNEINSGWSPRIHRHLRAATSGQAFPQCVFDHWDMLGSDPHDANSGRRASSPWTSASARARASSSPAQRVRGQALRSFCVRIRMRGGEGEGKGRRISSRLRVFGGD